LIEMNISINKAPPLKPAKSFIELRDKIQSLIDNYCEHEWSSESMLEVPFHCLKCGVKMHE